MSESPGNGDTGSPPHMNANAEKHQTDQTTINKANTDPPVLLKNAQKKLANQLRYEVDKA